MFLRFSSYPESATQVRPEGLPQKAPCPLPLSFPEFMGSLERLPGEGGWYSAYLFFQPLPDVEAQDRLIREVTDRLYECGWTRQVFPAMRPSGLLSHMEVPAISAEFTPDDLPEPPSNLVHHESKCAATWNTTFNKGQLFVQLEVQTGPAYDHWTQQPDTLAFVLPALLPPQGWTAETLAGSGSGNVRASLLISSLLLSGSGTVDELHAHYTQQLKQQGWTEQQHTLTPELILSVWQTPQGDQGQLSLVRKSNENWQATLHLTRLHELKTDGNLGSSWYSF